MEFFNMKKMIIIFSLFSLCFSHTIKADLFKISSNKSVYLVNEKPLLKATVFSKPENTDYQFDIHTELNNQIISSDRVTDYQMFSLPQNLVAGLYTWKVTLVIQDARYARDLKTTIKYYQNQIIDIDTKLLTETNPQVILDLQNQKTENLNIIQSAQSELQSIQTIVAPSQTIQFRVQ
jgi:hypothetical protein